MVVTGANSGIGLATTRRLVADGHRVVMACRNLDKAERAAEEIRRRMPTGIVEVAHLDLADGDSINDFATTWPHDRPIDVLVNNAGVMGLDRSSTKQGWESQFGTNHLGHFLLTGRLLPVLRRVEHSRVVTVSSLGHRAGRLQLDDVMFDNRRYDRWGAYFQSKLANVLFSRELDRRLKSNLDSVRSVGCHPGTASTEIGKTGTSVANSVIRTFFPVVARSADRGATAVVHAATAAVDGGEFFGPRFLAFGRPRQETPSRRARNDEVARRLWELSEELTGFCYEL